MYPRKMKLKMISVYTLLDLGDLSNLIGSLFRTIQQYSPPSEWIMCELSFFPILLENDLLKVDKILDFLGGRKRLRRIQNGIFPFTVTEFCGRWIMFTTPIYSCRRGHFVNSAFPNKKSLAQKSKFNWDKQI